MIANNIQNNQVLQERWGEGVEGSASLLPWQQADRLDFLILEYFI